MLFRSFELPEFGALADSAGLVQAAGVIGQQADPADRLEPLEKGDGPPDIVVVVVRAAVVRLERPRRSQRQRLRSR